MTAFDIIVPALALAFAVGVALYIRREGRKLDQERRGPAE